MNERTNSDGRATIIALFAGAPPQYQLGAVLLLAMEAVLLVGIFRGDTTVKLAGMLSMTAIAAVFALRLYPAFSIEALEAQLRAKNTQIHVMALETDEGKTLLSAEPHYKNATSLKRAGAYEKALRHYLRARATAPRSWLPRYNIGFCLIRLGRFDEAIREYKQLVDELASGLCVASNPSMAVCSCHLQIAAAFDHMGELNNNYSALEDALASDPDDPQVHQNLMTVSARLGNSAESRSWFDRLLSSPRAEQYFAALCEEDLALLERFSWFQPNYTVLDIDK